MLNYVIVYISSRACYSVYFPTNQSQPLINQLQSNSYSPLIGSFKFQALSLVKTQKRTSGHTRESILFSLSLVNQKPLSLFLQPITVKPKPSLPSQSLQTTLPHHPHPPSPRTTSAFTSPSPGAPDDRP